MTGNSGAAVPPTGVGIGLRAPHFSEIADHPDIPWLEVHSENYFQAASPLSQRLDALREHFPISVHGVGLSLGSASPLAVDHLRKLSELVTRIEPWVVSEHASWSAAPTAFLNDLLPLPFTQDAIDCLSAHVAQTQDVLRRHILIENVSRYLNFQDSEMPEWEFLATVATQAGCGLLLDINNIYVSSVNEGFDPRRYIDHIPPALVQEMHLAGHSSRETSQGPLLIDTHNQPVTTKVWELYRHAVARFGPVPTLIEWDADIPPLPQLLAEAEKAHQILNPREAVA